MTPLFFLFLIPIMTVWSGYPETGYTQHMVYLSTDVTSDCNHKNSRGCITDFGYGKSVIVGNPYEWDPRGCNILTHEWFHLMGYSEPDLPYCNDLKVPDYMLKNTPGQKS